MDKYPESFQGFRTLRITRVDLAQQEHSLVIQAGFRKLRHQWNSIGQEVLDTHEGRVKEVGLIPKAR